MYIYGYRPIYIPLDAYPVYTYPLNIHKTQSDSTSYWYCKCRKAKDKTFVVDYTKNVLLSTKSYGISMVWLKSDIHTWSVDVWMDIGLSMDIYTHANLRK